MSYFETKRLILRDFDLEDCDRLAPILADERVMRFSATGVLSPSQTKDKIAEFIHSYQTFGYGKRAVIFKQTKQLIGLCGIEVEPIDGVLERHLGYRLAPAFWGMGLAIEAASATIKYEFEKLDIPYVLAIVEVDNTASLKVLQKLGMKRDRETLFDGIPVEIHRLDRSTVNGFASLDIARS